jgi:hypothetical protein
MAFNNSGDKPRSENNFGVMQILHRRNSIVPKPVQREETFFVSREIPRLQNQRGLPRQCGYPLEESAQMDHSPV